MSAAIINPKWASFSELLKMAHLLVLALGLSHLKTHFQLLVGRLVRIGQKSGTKFLVIYLKECVRLTLAYLNHVPYSSPQKGTVEVRVGNSGLPLVIPGPIRLIIARFRSSGGLLDRLVTRTVLSIFCFYRVLQFKALPDLGTITGPFTGISQSFDISELNSVLQRFRLKIGPRLHWTVSEASGPNGPKSTWFCGADAIALMFHPYQWVAIICFGILTGRIAFISYMILIQILTIPILPILLLTGVEVPLNVGRLVCLTEGGGKRRIIAITDWWSQMVLRPLHDGLFAALKLIPQDGTFDQWKPVEDWVLPRIRLGAPCFSFDLSAATDRLPIVFQKQVLSILLGPYIAYFWGILLDRIWMFQGKEVRYSVGQPMGAYSSWGMLAFCHHVLVQLAAIRSGIVGWFPYYAIVGDDIVIADKAVADQYLILMRYLGVKISISKSMISESGLLEFAKRWASGHRGELSPVSPSLLMGCLRSPQLYAVLSVLLFDRDWLVYPEQLRALARGASRILKIPRSLSALMFATVIGPSGLLRNGNHVTAFAEQWFTSITKLSMGSAMGYIILGFKSLVDKDIADQANTARNNFEVFAKTWWRRRLFRGPDLVAGILSIPLILVSPGFWIYAISFYKALNAGFSASLNLAGLVDPSLAKVPGAVLFDLLELDDLASIDWSRRRKVKEQFTVTARLIKAVQAEIRKDLEGTTSLDLVPYDHESILSSQDITTEDVMRYWVPALFDDGLTNRAGISEAVQFSSRL